MARTEHDWADIRNAYESGATVTSLEKMGPRRSSIYARAKREGWDKSNRREFRRTKTAQNRTAEPNSTATEPNKPPTVRSGAPARVHVDPDEVEAYFDQDEEFQKTIAELEKHANFGQTVHALSEVLLTVFRSHVFSRDLQTGAYRIKDGLDIGEARRALGMLEQCARTGEKGIAIFRKSRGLYDGKTKTEHSGRVDGDRASNSLEAVLGFALQGDRGRAPAVSEALPGGPQSAEDLGGKSPDRQEFSDSN